MEENSEAPELLDQDIPDFPVGGNSEARELLDQYIHDFPVSGNMHDTAEASGTKAEIQPQPDDTKQKANYALYPGPDNTSVLYNQKEHITADIWEGKEREALICGEHTSHLKDWLLTEKQKELVTKAGFKHLMSIPATTLNRALISALVERWRKETNTFHMTIGEMTITLEDVAFLLGLPIDGKPVKGKKYSKFDDVCLKYLGKSPEPTDMHGGQVRLTWLEKNFSVCPEDASEENISFHTRAYLLYLIGHTILSNSAGDKVAVTYLPLFDNFEEAGTYAWGAAALSVLYRALGNASFRSQTKIGGSMTLLQCWSYYHLNINLPEPDLYPLPEGFPLALRWHEATVSNLDVVFYRKCLDSLTDSQIETLGDIARLAGQASTDGTSHELGELVKRTQDNIASLHVTETLGDIARLAGQASTDSTSHELGELVKRTQDNIGSLHGQHPNEGGDVPDDSMDIDYMYENVDQQVIHDLLDL